MTYLEKLKNNIPTISYEVYPPKDSAEWSALYTTLGSIFRRNPDFISVVFQSETLNDNTAMSLLSRIRKELNIESIAHLKFDQRTDAASEIIDFLVGDQDQRALIFGTNTVAYPSIRQVMKSGAHVIGNVCDLTENTLDFDVEHLKKSQNCGVKFAITHPFYDNELFYRFRDEALSKGISIPIIAGINPNQFVDCSKNIETLFSQCSDLLKNDVNGIHFYTNNASRAVVRTVDQLLTKGE